MHSFLANPARPFGAGGSGFTRQAPRAGARAGLCHSVAISFTHGE